MSTTHVVLMELAGGTGNLFNGLNPDWGPFGKLGATARIVIQALMAGVLVFLLGRAILGFAHMRFGQGQGDPIQVNKGKHEATGSLVGAFAVASVGTLFTIVYGLGLH